MKLLLLVLLAGFLPQDDPPEQDEPLDALRGRAEKIIEQNQSLEIDTVTARRRVQLLLKDMEAWAEESEIELETRTKTYRSPAKRLDEPLTADRCPLFFEEELQDLCPLDLARSEVWGVDAVFCRYLCTTK